MLHHCLASRAWRRTRAGRATVDALADIPPLCEEIERLGAVLACSRRRHQDLTAAARATLAADAEGEPDPLYYLRDELGSRGVLPSDRERSW
jgi:hypothetical protein